MKKNHERTAEFKGDTISLLSLDYAIELEMNHLGEDEVDSRTLLMGLAHLPVVGVERSQGISTTMRPATTM